MTFYVLKRGLVIIQLEKKVKITVWSKTHTEVHGKYKIWMPKI